MLSLKYELNTIQYFKIMLVKNFGIAKIELFYDRVCPVDLKSNQQASILLFHPDWSVSGDDYKAPEIYSPPETYVPPAKTYLPPPPEPEQYRPSLPEYNSLPPPPPPDHYSPPEPVYIPPKDYAPPVSYTLPEKYVPPPPAPSQAPAYTPPAAYSPPGVKLAAENYTPPDSYQASRPVYAPSTLYTPPDSYKPQPGYSSYDGIVHNSLERRSQESYYDEDGIASTRRSLLPDQQPTKTVKSTLSVWIIIS